VALKAMAVAASKQQLSPHMQTHDGETFENEKTIKTTINQGKHNSGTGVKIACKSKCHYHKNWSYLI